MIIYHGVSFDFISFHKSMYRQVVYKISFCIGDTNFVIPFQLSTPFALAIQNNRLRTIVKIGGRQSKFV